MRGQLAFGKLILTVKLCPRTSSLAWDIEQSITLQCEQ